MSDRYLGVVYVCSSCWVRLSECACEQMGDGWDHNRVAVPVDWDVYRADA